MNTINEHEIFFIKQIDASVATECDNNNCKGRVVANSIARKRWKILAKAIKKNGNRPPATELNSQLNTTDASTLATDDLLASVRRFSSFDLVQHDHLTSADKDELLGSALDWFLYKLTVQHIDYSVNIHHVNRPITASDLMGFNNTGNICVWPSEEALAFYVLGDINSFTGKMVLELGGGMTCLAGLLIAKYGRPYGVHLTDGNAMSVQNVQKTCRLNDIANCYVKCSVLKWEQHCHTMYGDGSGVVASGHPTDESDDNGVCALECEKFDYILSADCLFFDEAREALVETIWWYLSSSGLALVMAPRRGKTLELFVACAAAKGFHCKIVQRYNEMIWIRHLELLESPSYDEDIHYPILIQMTKSI